MARNIIKNKQIILKKLYELSNDDPSSNGLSGTELHDITAIAPNDINDAVALLIDEGYVTWHKELGTAPYEFLNVRISPQGKLFSQNGINNATQDNAKNKITDDMINNDTKKGWLKKTGRWLIKNLGIFIGGVLIAVVAALISDNWEDIVLFFTEEGNPTPTLTTSTPLETPPTETLSPPTETVTSTIGPCEVSVSSKIDLPCIYTTQRNDSYISISEEFYGIQNNGFYLILHNRKKDGKYKRLFNGTNLYIPPLDKLDELPYEICKKDCEESDFPCIYLKSTALTYQEISRYCYGTGEFPDYIEETNPHPIPKNNNDIIVIPEVN